MIIQCIDLIYKLSPDRPPLVAIDRLALERNTITAMLGHNGSGKSTLLGLLAGLMSYEGQIAIDAQDLRHLNPKQRSRLIKLLRQNPAESTYGDLTIAENLRISAPHSTKVDFGLLAHFNPRLADRPTTRVKYLSGGERQALALAMVLADHPRVLLLDEVTSALDPRVGEDLLQRTVAFARAQNLTLVIATHHIANVLAFSDQAYFMAHGRLEFLGASRNISVDHVRTLF